MELEKYIQIYDNVIPIDTLAHFIRFSKDLDFEYGKINKNTLDKKVRSVNLKSLTNLSNSMTEVHWHNFLIKVFEDNLNSYEKKFNKGNGPISAKILNIDLLKYNKSDHYKWHWDHFASIPRTLSCSLLLNNDYKGGNLCFRDPEGLKEIIIETKPARLIVWPSNFLYPHCVKPVTEGIRYSIVSWTL